MICTDRRLSWFFWLSLLCPILFFVGCGPSDDPGPDGLGLDSGEKRAREAYQTSEGSGSEPRTDLCKADICS